MEYTTYSNAKTVICIVQYLYGVNSGDVTSKLGQQLLLFLQHFLPKLQMLQFHLTLLYLLLRVKHTE